VGGNMTTTNTDYIKLEVFPYEWYFRLGYKYIKIPTNEYDKLCQILGQYVFKWFFVDKRTIRYYNDKIKYWTELYITIDYNNNFRYSFNEYIWNKDKDEIKAKQEIVNKLKGV
jgi:hypothetical protein